jgi:hypothetical protein
VTERQWELYRLSIVMEWEESPYKIAVIGAIKHKLMILALREKASIGPPDTRTAPEDDITPRHEADDWKTPEDPQLSIHHGVTMWQ